MLVHPLRLVVPRLLRTVLTRSFPALALALAACGPDQVAVRVAIPDQAGVETPLSGVRFIILPYDRDSILAVLERQAASPRPSTVRLDSLFQAFRGPFSEYVRRSGERDRLTAALDSLGTRLEGLARNTPEYAQLYARYQTLRDSAGQASAAAERARDVLDRTRRTVMPEADSLRTRIAAWEDTAFRSYDSITARLAGPLARVEAITDSTGTDGWATVAVPSGDWWVYARAINVQDPNAEWYWNVKIEGDTVRLGPTNGRSRPRFK